ncbi:MAG: macro domain-containing protein, partial [Acidobacteriales bacterium]|nr:macro domain-containing protein [Terriglobales bacterium]
GDITKQTVDAIVNAANSALAGGGGVDGAIHDAAGRELMRELNERYPKGCPTGEARITKGYNLPAKHVIHAVGPIYSYAGGKAPQLLAGAHSYSLKLAQEHGLKSVAFCAISTGIFGYPLDKAASVALNAVADYLNENQPDFELVRFVLFDSKALGVFSEALAALIETRDDVVAP